MFYVELGSNSTARIRKMAALPRVGDIVDFADGDDERIVLKIDRVVHIEDDEGNWSYFRHCSVRKNRIE